VPDYDHQWADLFVLEMPKQREVNEATPEAERKGRQVVYIPPVDASQKWAIRHPTGVVDDSDPQSEEEQPLARPANYTIMLSSEEF